MKALVKKYAKEGLWLEDMPEPTAGNNDVLIKIKKLLFAAPIFTFIIGMNGRKKPSACR